MIDMIVTLLALSVIIWVLFSLIISTIVFFNSCGTLIGIIAILLSILGAYVVIGCLY